MRQRALQKMGGASLIVVTAPNAKIMGPLVNGLGPMGKLLGLARRHPHPTPALMSKLHAD